MISPKVQSYIDDHTFCFEYLFKNWDAFLDLLYEEGGHVSSILWWDHCRKNMQHESGGSGGYTVYIFSYLLFENRLIKRSNWTTAVRVETT